eukprot:GABV01011109.1.p1 GENE.GABV01011109.1~~GABV01011109.1.p1  ORF type:complete len:110 (+),score=20.42 GABV01011109.1:100-429(+)
MSAHELDSSLDEASFSFASAAAIRKLNPDESKEYAQPVTHVVCLDISPSRHHSAHKLFFALALPAGYFLLAPSRSEIDLNAEPFDPSALAVVNDSAAETLHTLLTKHSH